MVRSVSIPLFLAVLALLPLASRGTNLGRVFAEPPSSPASAAESAPPNIVLFLVDDLGWQDVSVPLAAAPTPFNERYRTPQLARLAARGMRFTDAYAAAPVCTPTRTSILTGQDPGRTHITYWILHADRDTSRARPDIAAPDWRMNGLGDTDVTLPKLLRSVGYETIHVGKAHFGAHGTSGSDPRNLGYDVNIAGHASGGPGSYQGTENFSVAGREGKPERGATVWDVPGLEKYHGEDIFLTEALQREAVSALEGAVSRDKPFYLSFNPYAVHAPIQANRKKLAAYSGLDQREAAYATMIESVDDSLGAILDALDRLGVAENTLVLFTSDNGGLSAHARGGTPHTHNAPLRSGKGSAYEGGTRVAAVARWPGVIDPASKTAVPIISQDLFPTFLAAAGCPLPSDHEIDGIDLGGLFRGDLSVDAQRTLAARPLVWHQPHQWGAEGPGIEPYTAIRQGGEKLIYFHADRRFELYALGGDLGETDDLASAQPARVLALAAELEEWFARTGAQLSLVKGTHTPIEGPLAAARLFAAARGIDPPPVPEEIARAIACRPHPRQLAWQSLEFTAFVHFGVNTFTDREWGSGLEDPTLFAPTDFDADQWVKTFREAGMRMVLLTAKHHDGFCLWPSRFTDHSVAASPWRAGRGDVVGAVVDACRRHGLKFGFYLSPADLHEIEAAGGRYGNGSTRRLSSIPSIPFRAGDPSLATVEVDDYNRYFLDQLAELLTEYGDIAEVWFDGANPKPGTGQEYDYVSWYDLIRQLAPDATIAIKGPDVRWVGNEAGGSRAGEWSVIPMAGPAALSRWPDLTGSDLGSREKLAGAHSFHWYPAETNTSIRPGWFYHPSEDERVKPLATLLDIHTRSVGNNSLFLLNVPPDRRGRIHENDVARLRELGEVLRATYGTDLAAREGTRITASASAPGHRAEAILDDDPESFWTPPDHVTRAEVTLHLAGVQRFDRVRLREAVADGQRIERFAIDVWRGGRFQEVATGHTVGFGSIVRFPATKSDRVRLRILESRIRPTLAAFSVHREPTRLEVPTITRAKDGKIVMGADSPVPAIHYTLDGSEPTTSSLRYTQPIAHPEPVLVRARVVGDAALLGPEAEASLDLAKTLWRVRSVSSQQTPGERAEHAIDGDPTTIWHTRYGARTPKPPHQVTIDLGEERTLLGFTYLPRQNGGNGTVGRYRIAVSLDGQRFASAATGEFGNITRSPVEQRVLFEAPVRVRYLRFGALSEVNGNAWASAAEIGVIAVPQPHE